MIKFFHGWGKEPSLQQKRREELEKSKQELFDLHLQLEATVHGIAMRNERVERLEQEIQDEEV